ncbi:linear amide C-N hydrolase [Nocardia thailandica]|uniref:linear amide C-N hydrolase n=1 Tax=Nocardia thailandica TaxID=257275 RepID=UPI0003090B25|nr:linear amide C-N hydrolase [Nocardia thailandica]
MCTRVLWTGSGHGVLVGRNMDWHEDMPTNLWVLPRGLDRTGLADDPHPLTWTSRYGSLVAAAWDIAGSDGVNEAGLAGHVLWLAEADFGPRDTTRPGLTAALWLQYLLDRYDSVAAVVAGLAAEPVQVQAVSARGEVSTIHLALDDASGDSAVLEYVGGELRVHHDRAYTVMTNSPPFDEQLDHLRRYDGFGGDESIPGTTAAADRFVRAAYYSGRLPATDTLDRAYAALLSVMRNAAQPFGVTDPGHPEISSTLWRSLIDLTAGRYGFESSFRPDIVWVRPRDLDYTRCLRLDLSVHGLVGDVTDRFAPAEPFGVPGA